MPRGKQPSKKKSGEEVTALEDQQEKIPPSKQQTRGGKAKTTKKGKAASRAKQNSKKVSEEGKAAEVESKEVKVSAKEESKTQKSRGGKRQKSVKLAVEPSFTEEESKVEVSALKPDVEMELPSAYEEVKSAMVSSMASPEKNSQVSIQEKSEEEERESGIVRREVSAEVTEEWLTKGKIFAKELKNLIFTGLPKLDDEKLNEVIREQNRQLTQDLIKICSQKHEGFDPFKDNDFREIFDSLISHQIEGSSSSLKELRVKILNELMSHLPLLANIEDVDFQVEQMITSLAQRRAYGHKEKSALTYHDANPLALWCWEVEIKSLLSPYTPEQVARIRHRRSNLGKKVQLLNQIIDLSQELYTQDKLTKINLAYEKYNQLIMKERAQNVRQKRKLGEDLEEEEKKGEENFADLVKQLKVTDEDSYSKKAASNKPTPIKDGNRSEMKNQQQQVPYKDPKQLSLTSLFGMKARPQAQEAVKMKSQAEEEKNVHLSKFSATFETEASRVQQRKVFQHITLDELVVTLKNQVEEEKKEIRGPFKKLRWVEIADSKMSYLGIEIFKKPNLNARNPFYKDEITIDYDMDSEDEWQEMHGDDLENDMLLLEDDSSEYEDDSVSEGMHSVVTLNRGGKSICNKLKERGSYYARLQQLNEDDQELRRQGFIVDDDSVSFDSELGEDDVAERKKFIREMKKRHKEQIQGHLIAYVTSKRVDMGEMKACSLKVRGSTGKKAFLLPVRIEASEGNSKKEKKMNIGDKLDELVPIIHGVSNSKKFMQELIKEKFPDLRKTHVELFVKDCFIKEKMPQDIKPRLFAKVDALEKYGVEQQLIEKLPIILEQRKDEEKLSEEEKGEFSIVNCIVGQPDAEMEDQSQDFAKYIIPSTLEEVDQNIISSSQLLNENDLSLSQHAIVVTQQSQEVVVQISHNRSQQSQSTPISDFKKLQQNPGHSKKASKNLNQKKSVFSKQNRQITEQAQQKETGQRRSKRLQSKNATLVEKASKSGAAFYSQDDELNNVNEQKN